MNERLADAESKRWITKAESDLKHAKKSFDLEDYDWVLLASQQAGEKALKAICIKKGIGLTKTHDLSSLARKLKAPKGIIIEAVLLNPFYTISRYPDLGFLSEEESKNAAVDALNAA